MGTLRGCPGARAGGPHRLARGRQGGRPDRRRPALGRRPSRGIDSTIPTRSCQPALFRPHPSMVRAAWVRGRPARRSPGRGGSGVVSDGLDILIGGGTIVDGTGTPGSAGPWRSRVTPCGSCAVLRPPPTPSPPSRSGDGSTRPGTVVAPGFIDLHSHGGLVILAEPRHEPKVRQGVTTEVIGVDGNSYAPFRTQRRSRRLPDAQRRARRPARRSPTTGGRSPSTWRGSTGRSPSTSPTSSATRRSGSPPSAGTTCRPTPAMADQRALLREAHGGRRVRPRPGSTIRRAPMPRPTSWPTCRTRRPKLGGFYHTHVRYPLGDRFLDPFREAIEIGRRGERARSTSPTSITVRRSRARRGHARAWSTTLARRVSTSPSTCTRTSGPARGS